MKESYWTIIIFWYAVIVSFGMLFLFAYIEGLTPRELIKYIHRKKMKECKRHRWRVGSGNGIIIKGKIETDSLNIWCEKCDKKLKAYYHYKDPIDFKFKRKKFKSWIGKSPGRRKK